MPSLEKNHNSTCRDGTYASSEDSDEFRDSNPMVTQIGVDEICHSHSAENKKLTRCAIRIPQRSAWTMLA
eukprot:1454724-Prymnesium_polylepis.1